MKVDHNGNAASDNNSVNLETVPYLHRADFSITPLSRKLIEALFQHQDNFHEKFIENILEQHAISQLGEETVQTIKEAVQSQLWQPSEFFPSHHLAVFSNVISTDQLTQLNALVGDTNQCVSSLDVDPETGLTLRMIAAKATEAMYHVLNGYFPAFLDRVEGFYVESELVNWQSEQRFDAIEDYRRQMTIKTILSGHDVTMTMTGHDDNPTISLMPGSIIVYPSNWSASYTLQAKGKTLNTLTCHRIDIGN